MLFDAPGNHFHKKHWVIILIFQEGVKRKPYVILLVRHLLITNLDNTFPHPVFIPVLQYRQLSPDLQCLIPKQLGHSKLGLSQTSIHFIKGLGILVAEITGIRRGRSIVDFLELCPMAGT